LQGISSNKKLTGIPKCAALATTPQACSILAAAQRRHSSNRASLCPFMKQFKMLKFYLTDVVPLLGICLNATGMGGAIVWTHRQVSVGRLSVTFTKKASGLTLLWLDTLRA
jgi:hypothetical protein